MAFVQDRQEPVAKGGYVRLEEGSTKLRYLGEMITGWLDWDMSGDSPSPIRSKEQTKGLRHTNKFGNTIRPKPFRAMKVWDYQSESVKVWEVGQKSIRQYMMDLANEPDRGEPEGYDVTIKRFKDGDMTKYSVMPSNKSKFELAEDVKVNLNALYHNEDPFDVGDTTVDEDLPF